MFQTQTEFENRVGRDRVLQYLDRGLTGSPDPNLMACVLTDGNKITYAILNKKGYSADQLSRLALDPTIRRQVSWICAEQMALMKPELLSPDGTSMYTKISIGAQAQLTQIAMSILRPQAEQVNGAGAPATVSALTFEAQPAFEFAPNAEHPRGRGGF
jgi:hypothetical protein